MPYACACQVAAAAAAASASDDEERVANAPGAPSRAPFATAPRGVRLLANRLWGVRLTSATGSSPLGLLAITQHTDEVPGTELRGRSLGCGGREGCHRGGDDDAFACGHGIRVGWRMAAVLGYVVCM